MGYPKETKGYYFYHPDEQRLFVGLRAIFLEKEFLGEGTVASKIEFGEIQQVEVLGNQVPVRKRGGGILKFFIRLIILIYYMLDHI